MINLVEKMSYKVDIRELQEVVIDFVSRYNWDRMSQMCLLNTPEHFEKYGPDPYEGTGHQLEPCLNASRAGAFGVPEQGFTVFHPDYENTILGRIFKEFPEKVTRMRLMRAPSKACLTMHPDGPHYRYHIPVLANDRCFFVFKETQKIYFLPNDGHAYKCWVEGMHTFVNSNADFDRIHILLDGVWGQPPPIGKDKSTYFWHQRRETAGL